MKRTKNIFMIALFVLIIFGFSIAQLLLPDQDVSYSERRELTQAPKVTVKALFDRSFSDDLENYLLDQFPLREELRQVNAALRLYAFRQLDSNGIWVRDGTVFKTESATNLNQVRYAAQLYNAVRETYLDGLNVYYTIIPDKNWFAAEENGYPHLDYDAMVETMNENVTGATYIDIFDTLSLDKYYRTDTHWTQEALFPTAGRIAQAMGMEAYMVPREEYTAHELSPFYGVYLQQAALPLSPDTLTYLTNDYTQNAVVSGPMYEYDTVYVPELFEGMDGYDVFLGGSQPIVEITCPNAKTDRELYVFRDSFGSSLTPLFLGAYAKVTVIDLRYVASAYLGNFVSFTPGSDVLFMNSTLTLNAATSMR